MLSLRRGRGEGSGPGVEPERSQASPRRRHVVMAFRARSSCYAQTAARHELS